jgi:hypothetical protein
MISPGCRTTIIVLCLMMAVAGELTLDGQTAGIVVRLTSETHKEAIACGRSGADCAVTPYQLCPAELKRFSARIATPFSRVAGGVFESLAKGKRPDPLTPGAATRWGVGIYVLPAEQPLHADAIQRAEIRREATVIQPITSTMGPVTTTLPDQSTRQLTRAYFAFDPAAFSPEHEITIVLVGMAGTSSCSLSTEDLRRLR